VVGHAEVYRALVRCYPRSFRHEYGDDLVTHFTEMVDHRGPGRAWRRTTLDLVVTVPRYRLEAVMNPRRSSAALFTLVTVLALAGVLSILVGLYPGIVLLAIAVVVAVTQRSRLAQSTRPPDPERRHRLLRAAGALGTACVVSTAAFWIELSVTENWHGGKLAAYNAVFFLTSIGAVTCLIAALRTPRTRRQPAVSRPLA